MSTPLPTKPLASPPRLAEILSVFVATIALSLTVALWVSPMLAESDYRIVVSWASHVPQLLIPWLWYRIRVVPSLPAERRSLLRWPKGSTRLLLQIASWMVGLKFLGSMVEAWAMPTPQWVQTGFLSIALVLLFQGVFVGLSEEMVVRPALHQPLLQRVGQEFRIGPLRVSHAWLLTSILFGLFHLPNAFLGQPLGATLIQVLLTAIVGGIIGYYYERTRNFLGAALLHGLFDLVGYLPHLLVLPWK